MSASILRLDPEGFLLALEDWTPTVAERLAQDEGLTLTAAHWEIIEAARTFHDRYGLSPVMRALVRHVSATLGPEKGNSIYIQQLFPGRAARSISKIAGLPKPANCL